MVRVYNPTYTFWTFRGTKSLFMETIPPLTTRLMETFQLYKQTPEFKLKNYDFTLMNLNP